MGVTESRPRPVKEAQAARIASTWGYDKADEEPSTLHLRVYHEEDRHLPERLDILIGERDDVKDDKLTAIEGTLVVRDTDRNNTRTLVSYGQKDPISHEQAESLKIDILHHCEPRTKVAWVMKESTGETEVESANDNDSEGQLSPV